MLNNRGEVIGINTQKLVKKNVTGIGFALSATDLLEVLHRFYPNVSTVTLADKRRPAVVSAAITSKAEASPSSSEVSAAAGSSTEMRVASDNPRSASEETPEPAPTPVRPGFGTISIVSDPDSAEIYVDDKFVGNAPAKLKLAAGSHVMVIKAAGFAEWNRRLETLKDSQVTLRPVLERKP